VQVYIFNVNYITIRTKVSNFILAFKANRTANAVDRIVFANVSASHRCRYQRWSLLLTTDYANWYSRIYRSFHLQLICYSILEKRTCHWGFDRDNWRHYLLIPRNVEEAKFLELEKQLNQLKDRFDPSTDAFINNQLPVKRRLVSYLEASFPRLIFGFSFI